MMALEQHVQTVIGDRTGSLWEDLIRLYESDADAFYRLACDGAGDPIRDLAALAKDIRTAIHESYDIERRPYGAVLVAASRTISQEIPDSILPRVVEFLRSIDGKTISSTPGKDYVGTLASEAEARFKLGDRSTWHVDHENLQVHLNRQPLVFQLHSEESVHLASQPAYVAYSLVNCARTTVLAPTAVFKGLNRGEGCPTDLKEGWAFCGKPRNGYDNHGRAFPAPSGMVYMVYANTAGFIFDWDWVEESPDEPGYPIDWRLRFGNPHALHEDAVLEPLDEVKPGDLDTRQACYSSQGDCIFCYLTDEVASANRINSDLTVFKSLDTNRYTGFKIKNVRRILQVDQTIEMTDAPGLSVSVDSVLLATLKRHPEGSVQVYSVLIHALYKSASEPPKVRVPSDSHAVGARQD